MSIRACAPLVLLGLLTLPASAADYYVDVVSGDDANSGLSPAAPWKTLTHASQFAPAGSSYFIHVAPGTYSPTSGETFPLRFHDQVLVGDQGPDVTMLDGLGSTAILEMTSQISGALYGLTRVQGLSLLNASYGIHLSSGWLSVSTTVIDCRIVTMTSAGIHGGVGNPMGAASGSLTLERVTIEDCTPGINLSTNTQLTFTATDCIVRGCCR